VRKIDEQPWGLSTSLINAGIHRLIVVIVLESVVVDLARSATGEPDWPRL